MDAVLKVYKFFRKVQKFSLSISASMKKSTMLLIKEEIIQEVHGLEDSDYFRLKKVKINRISGKSVVYSLWAIPLSQNS